MKTMEKKDFEQYIGKHIYIEKANGKKVKGKLVAVDGDRVFLAPLSANNKKVETKFLFCFFIFGIIAVGLLAFLVCSCCGARRGRCGCGCSFERRRPCGCNRCRRRKRFHRRRRFA